MKPCKIHKKEFKQKRIITILMMICLDCKKYHTLQGPGRTKGEEKRKQFCVSHCPGPSKSKRKQDG